MRYDPVYQRLLVPLRPHVAAEVFVPRPMTEADWGQFMAVLATMKPGLVPSETGPNTTGLTQQPSSGPENAPNNTGTVQNRTKED